jgi:hypothetical protein
MDIKLLGTTSAPLSDRTEIVSGSAERLERSLASVGAGLLAVVEMRSSRGTISPLLVVRDSPDQAVLAAVLEDEQLVLGDAVEVVGGITGRDQQFADDSVIEQELPESVLQSLAEGGLIDAEVFKETVVGIMFCPDCGGWGRHRLDPCPPA